MSLNLRDNQTDKKALQAKEKASSQVEQATEKPKRSEKSKKARKEEKKNQKGRQEQREGSTPASGTNATLKGKKKNSQNCSWQAKDLRQIICYNCDKKSYYAYRYPKPKK